MQVVVEVDQLAIGAVPRHQPMTNEERIAIFLHPESKPFNPKTLAKYQLYIYQVAIGDYEQAKWYKHPLLKDTFYTGMAQKAIHTERYSLLVEFHGKVITFVQPDKPTANYFISAAPEDNGYAIATIGEPRRESDQSAATPATTGDESELLQA